MRMIHRAGLFLPSNGYYLFRDGKINGITWTGSGSGWGSWEINTRIRARAYIYSGETGSGSATVATTVDLRGFKHLHFIYSFIEQVSGTAPNIRVYPYYVSIPHDGSGPWATSYDLSAISNLSSVQIWIQSGHVSKSSSSGSVNSEIIVTSVWATRD